MTTTALIILIVLVALALWLIPGIDPTLRKILIAVCVIAFVVWLLYVLGAIGGGDIRIRD